MILLETQRLKFIKAMYGKDKSDKQEKVQCGNKWIVGWYLLGYPTLKDFQNEFTEQNMLDVYKQLKGEVVREPDSRFMGLPEVGKV